MSGPATKSSADSGPVHRPGMTRDEPAPRAGAGKGVSAVGVDVSRRTVAGPDGTPDPRRTPRSKENDMSNTKHRLATVLGAACVVPLFAAGIARADTPPSHLGNPALWGPAVANLCTSPAAAGL